MTMALKSDNHPSLESFAALAIAIGASATHLSAFARSVDSLRPSAPPSPKSAKARAQRRARKAERRHRK